MRALARMGLFSVLALVAGCMAQPMEETRGTPEGDEPTGDARESLPVVSYKPEDFPFITIVRDDGEGEAGGWQQAKASLSFWDLTYPHLPRHWQCPVTVKMPLRTRVAGPVPPSHAATISAQVAEDTARAMAYDLPPGIFCARYVTNMDRLFKSRYSKLGVQVTR